MTTSIQQIAEMFQVVTADIRFLPADEGGRTNSIDLSLDCMYRPHFIIDDRTHHDVEQYQQVLSGLRFAMTFIDGPSGYQNGDHGRFRFFCPYWSYAGHPEMNRGTAFVVLEGSKIVATGIVIDSSFPGNKQT